MCFSAEASFAVGAALLPAGVYCLGQSFLKKRSYLGLAAMPLFFGIQQISEGFVWLGLRRGDEPQTQAAALVFLLFALAVWPFWLPFQAALMETQANRKRLLVGLAVLASTWFWVLFFPLALDPGGLLTTSIEHHSIQYAFPGLPIYRYISKEALRVVYFATVALPFAISSERLGMMPGLVLGGSALVAALLFNHAYVSVWCFFAALLAGFLCVVFYRLPHVALEGWSEAPTFPRRDLENRVS
jgi:hypothetical protein